MGSRQIDLGKRSWNSVPLIPYSRWITTGDVRIRMRIDYVKDLFN
jgi:hypothetical protein